MSSALHLPDFVRILREGTDRGRFRWKETANPNSFRCSFGKGTVEITAANAPPLPPHYGVILFDDKNNFLEELWARSEGDTQAMGELYDRVRRSVLHIDEAIEELMKEIQHRAQR